MPNVESQVASFCIAYKVKQNDTQGSSNQC